MNKVLAFLVGIWLLSSCSTSSDSSTERANSQSVVDSVFRPAYHFSPYRNWMGKPISLLKHGDQYHLFFQYNDDDTDAEVNSWGHATSTDMMRWNELSSLSIFDGYKQGTIVSDAKNSSLLGENLMIALVNEGDEVNLLYSSDGFNWNEYDQNPVLEFDGIPKVTWDEQTNLWIMTLAENDKVTFFSSEDLINWSQESELALDQPATTAELFRMNESWGLLLNNDQGVNILTGDFDGSTFTPSQSMQPLDLGSDNTAGTVASVGDRSIYIGWMDNVSYTNDLPTKSWKSSLTTPRTLSMNNNNQLIGFPVEELKTTLTSKRRGKLELLKGRATNWYSFTAITSSTDIEISILNEENEKFLFTYNTSGFTMDRTGTALNDFNADFAKPVTSDFIDLGDTIQFDIFIDRSSVEVFINKGQLQFTSLVFSQNPFRSAAIKIDGAQRNIPATIYDVDMYED